MLIPPVPRKPINPDFASLTTISCEAIPRYMPPARYAYFRLYSFLNSELPKEEAVTAGYTNFVSASSGDAVDVGSRVVSTSS
ncbi:hypothetical protein D3C80_1501120 [compost metagenome]